jgi:ketosteroid isomerase-like protein
MSVTATDSNVEIVKEMYESFAEEDIEAVAATWAPDIEMNEPVGLVHGGTFQGADEVMGDVFSVMGATWQDVSAVPDRFIADGDTVVAFYTWSGTSIETGKDVEYPGVHVFEFDDGAISQWTSYGDTALYNAALDD